MFSTARSVCPLCGQALVHKQVRDRIHVLLEGGFHQRIGRRLGDLALNQRNVRWEAYNASCKFAERGHSSPSLARSAFYEPDDDCKALDEYYKMLADWHSSPSQKTTAKHGTNSTRFCGTGTTDASPHSRFCGIGTRTNSPIHAFAGLARAVEVVAFGFLSRR